MKHNIFDVLRRGADNTVANWPLILIRFAESFVFFAISIVAVLATLVPILVSVGIRLADIHTPDAAASAVVALAQKWVLLLWILVAACALLLVLLAIHSFVQAGCARVLVDGDRQAGPVVEGLRSRYAAFSGERWLAGATSGWWSVFWIFNIAWGLGGLLLLIPLLPTAVLMVVFREKAPAVVAIGCVGLVATLLLTIVVGITLGMWITRAIAENAVKRQSANAALGSAWRAIRADVPRHLVVTLAVIVVAIAASTFFAGFSFFGAFGEAFGRHAAPFQLMFLPVRIGISFVSSFFSAIIASWYLASYAALAAE